jgi:hypothetical protein
MSNAIERMREAFADSFMKPEAFRLDDESMAYELAMCGLDVEEGAIYARLSASGFLDCLEWLGPFDTLDAAADELVRLYADD